VVPHLSDLISFDFYLWETDKGKFYETNFQTLGDIRNNTCSDISTISGEEIQRVTHNLFHRCTGCIRSGRQNFQHLVKHW
jgi:hypothetical protein